MTLPALPPIGTETRPLDSDPVTRFEKVVAAARWTGIPQLVGLTFEGIQRLDSNFRAGILTVSGKIPLEDYPKYWSDTMAGRRKISAEEFNVAFFGAQFMEEAKRIPLIPNWTKEIWNPETLASERVPVLTAGSLLNFSTDVVASPLTYLALGAGPAKNLLKGTPLWSPFAATGRGINYIDDLLVHRAPGISWLMMRIREPGRALEKHMNIVKELYAARDKMITKMSGWNPVLHNTFWGEKPILGGLAKGAARKFSELEEKRVMNHLFKLNVRELGGPLTTREQGLADDVMTRVIRPIMDEMKSQGKFRNWKEEDLLGDILPQLVNTRTIPGDILQSWDWKTMGIMRLPIYKDKAGQLARMQITPENLNLQTAIRDLVYASEKNLIWNAQTRVKTATGTKLLRSGPLLKFKPRKTRNRAFQNPNVRDLSTEERLYLTRLINEITGHARGRDFLSLREHTRRFVDNLRDVPQIRRISKLIFRDPDAFDTKLAIYSKPTYATQFFVHNVVRNMLWLNLGAAIKNTSQILNTATIKGIPKTIKGMFDLSFDGRRRELAADNVWNEFRNLMVDERWVSRAGDRLDKIMMAPFNAVENFARGTAFNVYLDDAMKARRISSIDELLRRKNRDVGKFNEIIREAVNGSYETNFIYGVMGRPASVLGSPALRPATTLLSFPLKQAEFMRRAFLNDGAAVARFMGMHGLSIDLANRYLGIAPENWLGWGFLPPFTSVDGLPLMASPQVRWGIDLARGLSALADGRETDAIKHFRAAQSSAGPVMDMPANFWRVFKEGRRDVSPVGTGGKELGRSLVAGLPMTGWIPFPIVAVARAAKVTQMLKTGVETSSTGETWVPVTKADALKTILFQTTTQRSREELRTMVTGARRRVDSVLDKRVRQYLAAARGTDGQAVVDAAIELTKPIRLSHGLVKQPPTTFLPFPEQIERRIENQLRNKTQSRDLTLMQRNGFLMDVYWAAYIDLVLRSQG